MLYTVKSAPGRRGAPRVATGVDCNVSTTPPNRHRPRAVVLFILLFIHDKDSGDVKISTNVHRVRNITSQKSLEFEL